MNKRGFTLVEIIIVIAIVAILLSVAGPPFMEMLRRSSLEESAQRLQEAIKSAQVEAQKRGDTEFGNISTASGIIVGNMKRSVYYTLNPDNNMIRIVAWNDRNIDGLKTDDEFTLVQELFLGQGVRFDRPVNVVKNACGTNVRDTISTDGIINFTPLGSPIGLSLFPDGTRYIKLNGKGFAESMNFVSIYLTGNNGETFAVTMSPAGLTGMCRWDNSGSWIKIR